MQTMMILYDCMMILNEFRMLLSASVNTTLIQKQPKGNKPPTQICCFIFVSIEGNQSLCIIYISAGDPINQDPITCQRFKRFPNGSEVPLD